MKYIFHRSALAEQMKEQLLHPGVLDEGLRLELRILLPANGDPDAFLLVMAGTLRSTSADIELVKVEQLGALTTAVFGRIASATGDAKGLFSAEALTAYKEATGQEVRADEVQVLLNELMAANVVMRRGHGLYGLTDPFVQEIWLERKALMG